MTNDTTLTLRSTLSILVVSATLIMCRPWKSELSKNGCSIEKAKEIAFAKFKRKYGEKITLLEAKDTVGNFYIVMSTIARPPERNADVYTMYTAVSTQYWFSKDDCEIVKTLHSQ